MRLTRHCLLGMLGIVAAAPAPAAAQSAPAPAAQPAVDPNVKKAAKQYVTAGIAAQDAGDYDTAVKMFSKAYELVPHPTLLFNMAQAHRLAGRAEQALRFYNMYVAQEPNGPQAPAARDWIAQLQARKAAAAPSHKSARPSDEPHVAKAESHKAEPREAESRKPESHKTEPRAADDADDDDSVEPAAEPPAPAPASDQPAGHNFRLYAAASGTAGVIALSIGIGYGLHARSIADSLSQPSALYDLNKVHAGEHANAIAITGIISGIVLIGAGAGMYWHSRQHPEPVALVPTLSDHSVGLALTGSL